MGHIFNVAPVALRVVYTAQLTLPSISSMENFQFYMQYKQCVHHILVTFPCCSVYFCSVLIPVFYVCSMLHSVSVIKFAAVTYSLN